MIKWRRAQEGFVDSHDGQWKITPEYWSCVNPQAYSLSRKRADGKWERVASSCATQRDAKAEAEAVLARERRAQ